MSMIVGNNVTNGDAIKKSDQVENVLSMEVGKDAMKWDAKH